MVDKKMSEDVLRMIRMVNAIAVGHYVLKNGQHSAEYVNKDDALIYPRVLRSIAKCMHGVLHDAEIETEVLVGPAEGGINLSSALAREFYDNAPRIKPLGIWASKDREKGGFCFRGKFAEYINGRKVVITEDIVTSGSSVEELVEAVSAAGGEVVAVVAIVDRSGGKTELYNKTYLFLPLATLDIPLFHPDHCPLCAYDVPINTDLGHGGKQK